jgi:hypothetical protein
MCVTSWVRKLSVVVVGLVVSLTSVTGCGNRASSEERGSDSRGDQDGEEHPIRPGAAPERAPDVDYFANASSLPGLYKAKVGGPARALELLIYPKYGYAQIQDPRKPENVDRYDVRDGVVTGVTPVKVVGPYRGPDTLATSTFSIDDVDFSAVPKMVADARAQLNIEDGKVTHIILQRPLPFASDVRFRVYLSGPRKNGSVEYDARGNLKKVWGR